MFHNLILISMIFFLRDINDDFNISKELKLVCLISAICLQSYTFVILFLNNTAFVVIGYG